MKLLATQGGLIRVLDTGGHKHPLLIVPDGPCVIEHYADLIDLLSPDFRVVCLDLPGFGFSYPSLKYDFSVSQLTSHLYGIMCQKQKLLPLTAVGISQILNAPKNIQNVSGSL